jgi:DNA-binding GntR family transcriptional regulator
VRLDRNSGVPLHVQIRELIRLGVAQGAWRVGETLPPEEELCRSLGVSRGTIRQALNRLVQEGLLVRQRRAGTRIVRGVTDAGLLFISPYRAIQAAGMDPKVQVLALEKRRAPDRVLAAWGPGGRRRPRAGRIAGRQAVHFDRVFWANGEPVARGSSWAPLPRFERLLTMDLTSRAFLDVLARDFGVVITRIDERMELTAMSAENARLLRGRRGAPCLAVTLCQWSRTEPVEYAEFWLDPAKSRFLLTGVLGIDARLARGAAAVSGLPGPR